jgi:hypothetical protein
MPGANSGSRLSSSQAVRQERSLRSRRCATGMRCLWDPPPTRKGSGAYQGTGEGAPSPSPNLFGM